MTLLTACEVPLRQRPFYMYLFFVELRVEPRILDMLGRHCTTKYNTVYVGSFKKRILILWKAHICVQCVLIIYTPHHPLTAPISTFCAPLTSCLLCCCCFSNPFSSVSWVWGPPLEWEHQWKRIVDVLFHIAVFFIQILQQSYIFLIVESTSGILEVLHKIDSEGVSQNHTSHAVSAATSGFVSKGNAHLQSHLLFLPSFSLSFGHSVICHGENQLCVLRNCLLLFEIRLSLTHKEFMMTTWTCGLKSVLKLSR